MGKTPLRDWDCGSYREDGRPVSSLEDKQAPTQMPKGEGANPGVSMGKNAADPMRRNK